MSDKVPKKKGKSGPLPIDYWNASKAMYKSEIKPGNGFESITVKEASEIESTGEIKAWKREKDKSILVGIRGTVNSGDFQTNLLIPTGLLTKSQRWKTTSEYLTKLHAEYGKKYKYYISGHSLGGALVTEALVHFPWIAFAREYNPAVEPFYATPAFIKNRIDVYNTNDPLYFSSGYNQRPIKLVETGDNIYSAHLMNSLKKEEEKESVKKKKIFV